MFHLVSHARPRRLVFHTQAEGMLLLRLLARHVPGLVAACVMPDHVHVQTRRDARPWFLTALRAYTRARNARRNVPSDLFIGTPEAQHLATPDKVRRSIRYIHLNPCRAGLVTDPLAWPMSTYRDRVGLSLEQLVPAVPDPSREHAYTSGDPSVDVAGTWLPGAQLGDASLPMILEAVGALLRVGRPEFERRGPARTLFLRASSALTPSTAAERAAFVGVDVRTARRQRARYDTQIRRVQRVCGDPRLGTLDPRDVRLLPGRWRFLASYR